MMQDGVNVHEQSSLTLSHTKECIENPSTLLSRLSIDESSETVESVNNVRQHTPQNTHPSHICAFETNIHSDSTSSLTDTTINHSNQSICRICHCGNTEENLLTPCKCRGTSQYVHGSCLVGWFRKKRNKTCELCLYEVKMKRRGFQPFSKWTLPRRKCDFLGFLFVFYSVILIVFVIMILKIASNGCRTTVCVVLYFVSVISLIYFSYCCGFVVQIKRCWTSCLDLNRQIVVENRQESLKSISLVVDTRTRI